MLVIFFAALAIDGECLAVGEQVVRARHLAERIPAAASIDSEAIFGFSPRHGVRRHILGIELAGFIRKHGGTPVPPPDDLCVARPGEVLSAKTVRDAILHAASELRSGRVTVEIRDFAKASVPPGQLVFPATLAAVTGVRGEVYWRGYVQGPDTKVPVWARALVEYETPVAVAARGLKLGEVVDEQDVRMEIRKLAVRDIVLTDLAAVLGRAVSRPIPEGAIIAPQSLTAPRVIARGEVVRVDVESGSMKLHTEAKAETSGRLGEPILLRNPNSGQRFEAIVTGRGRTEVKK
jgi:flagella basal body P-ring formation protein FlgA